MKKEREYDKKYSVALVGATGLVGQTFLRVLEELRFPVKELKLFASKKSKGKKILAFGRDYTLKNITDDSVEKTDIAFFSTDAETSGKITPIFLNAGALVIDNSSFHRTNPKIPLIVPEVNLNAYNGERIIANPNCSTIQAVLPLSALSEYGILSVNYTTYQAVSGSGKNGISDLKRTLNGKNGEYYPYNISKNCIPQIGGNGGFYGYTEEEVKMINETKKILGLKDLPVSATCVRVPVENCHAVSVRAELEKEFDIDKIIQELSDTEGVEVLDDLDHDIFPVQELADGKDIVFVGRIRRDLSAKNGLLFYTVADNLRKGAATNAVQTALGLIKANKI
ncbi:MAG: aspartate-semialdehyde dehydrogenase [bacterium]|nr:aspartate-semialdehyde dehydrogenase [bacterium]